MLIALKIPRYGKMICEKVILDYSTDNCKHSDKCTFYTLKFDCSFAAANTIKPQLL